MFRSRIEPGSKPIKCGSCNGHGKQELAKDFLQYNKHAQIVAVMAKLLGTLVKTAGAQAKTESRKCFS